MEVLSVERDNRPYYLTCGPNPKGKGILAIISKGSPQRGDMQITVCDLEICENMKAAKKWYKRQMKSRPWEQPSQTIPLPKGIGRITELHARNGKLIADTTSGVKLIIPLIRDYPLDARNILHCNKPPQDSGNSE